MEIFTIGKPECTRIGIEGASAVVTSESSVEEALIEMYLAGVLPSQAQKVPKPIY